MKTDTVIVVIGALRLVKNRLERYTNNIPGNNNIFDIQRIAIRGTAHIFQRILPIKYHFKDKTSDSVRTRLYKMLS